MVLIISPEELPDKFITLIGGAAAARPYTARVTWIAFSEAITDQLVRL